MMVIATHDLDRHLLDSGKWWRMKGQIQLEQALLQLDEKEFQMIDLLYFGKQDHEYVKSFLSCTNEEDFLQLKLRALLKLSDTLGLESGQTEQLESFLQFAGDHDMDRILATGHPDHSQADFAHMESGTDYITASGEMHRFSPVDFLLPYAILEIQQQVKSVLDTLLGTRLLPIPFGDEDISPTQSFHELHTEMIIRLKEKMRILDQSDQRTRWLISSFLAGEIILGIFLVLFDWWFLGVGAVVLALVLIVITHRRHKTSIERGAVSMILSMVQGLPAKDSLAFLELLYWKIQ